MSLFSLLTVIFSFNRYFLAFNRYFLVLTCWKPYTARLSTPKKEKKKKEKKRKGFLHEKQFLCPRKARIALNLAKARLRGCFFQMIIENQKQKKSKRTMNSLRSYFSKAKALDSKNYREQPVFLKAVFQGGNKRTFIVSL